MGCHHANTPQGYNGNVPLPTVKVSPNQFIHAERPSLRRQIKLQNLHRTPFQNNSQMTQNVVLINGDAIRQQNQTYLSGVLNSHFFFHNISDGDRREIIKQMCLCEAKQNTYIFKQNDMASAFFIIQDGSVLVEIGGQPKKSLSRGSYFGELALLYASPRSASIKVLEPTRCWCITRGVFRKTMQCIMQRNYGVAKGYINKLPLFGFLTQSQKDSIAYSMFILKYVDGEVIFKQNDDANSFFIITKGNVGISVAGKPKITLSPGDSFGEQSFKQDETRTGTATSKGQTLCLSIGRDAIKSILGGQISTIIYYNISKWALKRSQYLSKLTNIEIQKLLSSCKYTPYRADQKVYLMNKPPSKVVIVLEGKINGLSPGTLIGQEFFKTYLIENVSKEFVKQGDGIVAEIPFQTICTITNKSIQQIIKKPLSSCHDKKMEQLAPASDYSHIKMQNLVYIKKLGQGQFGKVYSVKDKPSGQLYAVKCISKQQVIKNKMEKIMLEERNILEVIDSTFLLKFYRSFKDEHFIYLITQYIRGSELFDVIREIGLLAKSVARFYISSIILGIQYLHLKAIIYRDLKPENIMVESTGYLKLIDMGTAKQLKQSNGFRTFTIIGTPHYMAPEVMNGKGYSFSADIWTIGVIFYEFLCGKLPFGDDLEDPYQVHNAIIKNQIKYPSYVTDLKAKNVIQQLLSKAPDSRLTKGFPALKAQPFFDGFDWQQLYSKQMKVPYLPKKSQLAERPHLDGTAFHQMMRKEKLKMKLPQPSTIAKWDQIF